MRTRRLLALIAAVPVLAATLPAALPAAALPAALPGPAAGPLGDAAATAGLEVCDDSDPADCLFPFPNDHFTVADDRQVTGRRIDISPLVTPQNVAGRPVDTTEQNRNDGFSPGQLAMTFVPGLDLQATWQAALGDPDAAAATELDLSRSLHADAPIVVINARTGERHPYFDELDLHPETADDERLLLIRPAVNYEEGERYIIALRDLRDATGAVIPAGDAFRAYLDGAGAQPAKQAHLDADVLPALAAAGIDPDDLYLAWDFTVASWQNLAGRMLHIRDEAFRQLGDHDLGDLEVDGVAPRFTIDYVDESDGNSLRVVHGAVEVPNFLTLPQQRVDAGRQSNEGREVPAQMVPGSRFLYLDGDDLPDINPAAPTMEIPFSCAIPTSTVDEAGRVVDPARPTLYGHGLLGQRYEGPYWSGGRLLLTRHGVMNCGVDWLGMSTEDLANVGSILVDGSNMASLADRGQQGFLGFLMVGRAMLHPDGFAAHEAWQDVDGQPLIDTSELFYDGHSQGGIMGGALTAVAPDFTKATLGVPGMNYSTLLNRSVDWEGELIDPAAPDLPAYSSIMYASYPDKQDQQLVFALLQMLWDRSEANGYAHHMTDDPYPNTPAHRILLHAAFGDFQVTNLAAEVMARTAGAHVLQTSLPAGRHWSRDPGFGLPGFAGVDEATGLPAHDGSALVYFDSGNLVQPTGNLPPAHVGSDPHGHPRGDLPGGVQRSLFYDTGVVVDTRAGAPWVTAQCPAQTEVPTGVC
jgi:hypothetical protein